VSFDITDQKTSFSHYLCFLFQRIIKIRLNTKVVFSRPLSSVSSTALNSSPPFRSSSPTTTTTTQSEGCCCCCCCIQQHPTPLLPWTCSGFPFNIFSLSLCLSLLVQLFSRKENRERKKETATGFSYGFFSVR